jgi:hypothetical protein
VEDGTRAGKEFVGWVQEEVGKCSRRPNSDIYEKRY